MKLSVLIPAYNCAATIESTLDSVLGQTRPPHEILVMDDGSTDETGTILRQYGAQIKTFWQPNAGLSNARNALIARTQGDRVAFLDADDVWHPEYLEVQQKLCELYPDAVATFVEHVNLVGLGPCNWSQTHSTKTHHQMDVELFTPIAFIRRYWAAPGPFVMSFCCVSKRVLDGIGVPFRLRIAEDLYFCSLLPFWGPVAYCSAPPLAAYRIREGSLSSNRLRLVQGELEAFALVERSYRDAADERLREEYWRALSSKRREYAKILLGAGKTKDARGQLRQSLIQKSDLGSRGKSLAVLLASYIPKSLQPKWPPVQRQWNPVKS